MTPVVAQSAGLEVRHLRGLACGERAGWDAALSLALSAMY